MVRYYCPRYSQSCVQQYSAASTAFITAALSPPRSSAATPLIVVPPGEQTASFIAPGCEPVHDGGIGESFQKHAGEGGAAAADGTGNGKLICIDKLHQRNFGKYVFYQSKFTVRQGMAVLADKNTFSDRYGSIGDGTDMMCARQQDLFKFFKWIAGGHGYNDLSFRMLLTVDVTSAII